MLTVDGVTDSVTGWAIRTGLTASLIASRLRAGWGDREAVMTPRQRSYRGRGA
jgi:hypothetical protein